MKLVQYDASDSAQIRLYGDFFAAVAHEEGNYWEPSLALLCPSSLQDGFACSRCAQGMPKIQVCLCLCRSRKQWSVYMTKPMHADSIMKECMRMGYSPEDMRSGKGPDILLHRYSPSMFVRSNNVGPAKMPDFLAELLDLAKNSKWYK